jgi:hypothetical protein
VSERSKIVQVGVAPNEAIALWWKQILEDEGIVVMLRPGGIGQGYFANALNEHYLLAREDQAEEAVNILNELVAEDESEFAGE